MKNLLISTFAVAAVAALPLGLGAAPRVTNTTAAIYINNSPLSTAQTPPQIDAVAFLNRSIFDVITTLNFEGQNVRYWTNIGTMDGFPGFDFENVTDGAHLKNPRGTKVTRNSRHLTIPSAMFVNDGNISGSTSLNINSTNISMGGRLDSTEAGTIKVNAPGYADFSRGGIRVGSTPTTGNVIDFTTCAFPDVSSNFLANGNVVDLYWGGGVNNNLGTNGRPLDLTTIAGGSLNLSNIFGFSSQFDIPFPQSPVHQVIERLSGRNFTNTVTVPGFGFFLNGTNLISGGCGGPYGVYVHTNANGTTGMVYNIVFVPTNSTLTPSNMFVEVFFTPVSGPAADAYAPIVEFRNVDFDLVNQAFITNYVTLVDSTAVVTNMVLARPLFTTTTSRSLSVTRRPWTYSWARGRFCDIDFPGFAVRSNADFSPSIFYNPATFSTNIVNTLYAADSVQVGQSNSQAFANSSSSVIISSTGGATLRQLGVNPALSDPTNFAGSVSIVAHELNMANTRIRAEDFIGIHTDNLVSNALPAIDAPFIDFDIRSTNSVLVISNIAPATVSRLAGEISAWSGAWSVNVTNTGSVPGQTNPAVHNIRFHVLIVDNCLRSEQPVTVNRFIAHAPAIEVHDNLFVNSGVVIDANALTIEPGGSISLPTPSNLAFTNVLDLLNFTNYGTVNVPGAAYFGMFEAGPIASNVPPKKRKPVNKKKKPVVEKPAPLDNFFDQGTITASSILIRGTNVETAGGLTAPAVLTAAGGVIIMKGESILVSNATLLAGADIEMHGNDVHLADTFLSAGSFSNFVGQFSRGSILIDATNSFGDVDTLTTNDWVVTGGIKVTTTPASPGDLLGTRVTAEAAPLVSVPIVWAGRDRGADAGGFAGNLALGRLVLDGEGGNLFHFSSATASNALYVEVLELRNDATNFNFTVGVDPDFTIYFADSVGVPPEKLSNPRITGGRLVWVSSFAGPQTSTNLVYPDGQTHTFNRALVTSIELDSDGDGIVNAQDCTPIPVPGIDTTAPENNCPVPPLSPAAVAKGLPLVQSIASADLGLGISVENQQVTLHWNAPASSANTVEFSDEIGGEWQQLTNFISGPVGSRVTVKDSAGAPLRVYRVRVDALSR